MNPSAEQFLMDYLSPAESRDLARSIDRVANWQNERFHLFGKSIEVPRLTAWCGEPGVSYRYTGIEHVAHGWFECLDEMRKRIALVSGVESNFVVLNRYAHGDDYMGWHRDDERGCMGHIASLSLGESRRFQIEDEAGRREYRLGAGALLIFDGAKRHRLPKEKRVAGSRINLTFRRIASESCDEG